MSNHTVLIVGGYGVVGTQIAELLRKHRPDVHILLGGRNPKKGEDLAAKLGNAQAVAIDLSSRDPLADLSDEVDLVVASVNDIDDALMLSAVEHGVPYIDITRWTARLRNAILRLSVEDTSRAPVVFSSSWMAGVAATLARVFASQTNAPERIDIGILYALKDDAGPNSVEYMDRLNLPFEVTEAGKVQMTSPFRYPVPTDFMEAGRFKTYRFDTPDQLTLPWITGAKTVAARIGFDDKWSAPFLSFLVRTGIWGLFSGERFKKLRHKLLHNPGTGAAHSFRIDVTGNSKGKKEDKRSWLVTDPLGQKHLTATGALIQIDRMLTGLENGSLRPGVQIAEAHTPSEHALDILANEGIEVMSLT